MKYLLLLFFLSLQCYGQLSSNFHSSKQPIFELGLGAININIPYYPGAKNNQNLFIPFIWPIYRGKTFRFDQEGNRAKLTDNQLFELGMSFWVTPPIKAEDNPIRSDLRDLEYVGEIGPRLILRIISNSEWQKLNINFSLRAAYEISAHDLRSKFIGLSGGPSISYWIYLNKSRSASLFTTASWFLGDQSYNNFFYGTKGSKQLENYQGASGEISRRVFSRIAFNLTNRVQVFLGGFYADLKKNTNLNSPLIESKTNSGFAFGFLWNFYQSEKKVNIYGG